ncbi:hypothetical protein MC885_007046, partial [Smutsia gigantea]
SSRFRAAAGHREQVDDLVFLKEIQDLAEEIYEMMDKAKNLQHLWVKRSKTPEQEIWSLVSDSMTMDLNKMEELISKLESLHRQPHIWDFLLFLPELHADNVGTEDGIRGAVHLLQAVLNSVTSLEDLDWLPFNHTFSTVSEIMLNVTISMLTFLQENGAAATESGYHLSLQKLVWHPQKVKADLRSRFGFDVLHAERILNYPAELQEIPTDSLLDRMVCSVLSSTSEDEADRDGHHGDCHPRWSAARHYLVRAVSWLQVYRQVFRQWQKGGLLQKVLAGAARSLEVLRSEAEEDSEPWRVAEALLTAVLLLNESVTADGPEGSHASPQLFLHLQKLQNVLQNLPQQPALKTLLRLHGALTKAIAQNLHFAQEVLAGLETAAKDPKAGGPDQLKLEKGVFFQELKQLLMKNATVGCLRGHGSEGAAVPRPGNASVWASLQELMCHRTSSNETRALTKLLGSAEDTGHLLQEVIMGHTNMSKSVPEGYPGWREVERQLSEASLSCTRLFQLLAADISLGDGDVSDACKDQLISTVILHTLGEAQVSLGQTSYCKAFTRFISRTCEVARYVNMQESFPNSLFAFSEESPCYEEHMNWKVIIDNYFEFFENLLKSPKASISRVLNSTKELLMTEKKFHVLEDGQVTFLLSFVGFLEQLLLPNPLDATGASKFYNLASLTDIILNKSSLWINHLNGLERDPSSTDTQKLWEFDKEMIENIPTLEGVWIRKELRDILRFMELMLSEINPKLRELWMYGTSEGERSKLKTLSTLLNLSLPEDKRVLSKSFNFSQLFHSDWPKPSTVKMDFVHLSETVINSLCEFGFLRQNQASGALDTVYTIQNASDLFSALSETQKQQVDKILTHLYLNVFKNKDSALLLQIYSAYLQYIYKFLSIQSRESLLSFLTQTSKHILDITKQFNFQNISKAFSFLYETAGLLQGLAEVSYCQQLISIFNFLEHQAQSLTSPEGSALEMVHATLMGLKQLLIVDEDFRISLFQYMSQLFNGSVESLLGGECFPLANKSIGSVNYSTDGRSSSILLWAQFLSNLSADGKVFSEFTAVHCTISWLQMWAEICGSISQILKVDMNVFPPLLAGLHQLLDELESDVKIPKSCQGIFPTHHPARFILNLFKNVTQADGIHDWVDFLNLRDLSDAFVRVKLLNPDQVEKSLFTMETALHQLMAFPANTNASREFLYSLLDVFIKLSNTSGYTDRNVHWINHFLSKNLTNEGGKFESVITELRETILFFRNVSHDQDLVSCAGILQNVTEFILEDSLLCVNTSQQTLHILAMLNYTFSSEDAISRLKGCIKLVDVINHLYAVYNSTFSQGPLQGILRSFRDVEDRINSTLKLVTWILNIMEPPCSLNESNVNCVNINLKHITDFLNVILTASFEREKIPTFGVLLTFLNDSTNQVRMIINNLTRDFDFASQSNWKHFAELALSSMKMSGESPSQFQNIWLHLVAVGKEIQKLMEDMSSNILEGNSSSKTEKFLNVFAASANEKDIKSLGNSFYHLAHYLALNLSHELQNSPKIIPHEIMQAAGLGIQVLRDVFNSLMPLVHHYMPRDPGKSHVLKKVTSFLHTLKNPDIGLLEYQLEHISESLKDFIKNISRLGPGDLGVDFLVDLMETFLDSSHSWNVNHLLKLSRLFPKDDVNAVVDMYYALPHAMRLLRKVVGKNITEILKDVYNLTLLHGISISNVTKDDFAIVIKTLLETIELISDKPGILSEALTCLPVVWCWNHTTSGFEQNPKFEACNARELMSSFYSKVASILDHLHMSPPGDVAQCSNESSQMEITRRMVCAIHELMDCSSILLELSEILHMNTLLVETVQEFWHKVLPFGLSFGSQSNGSISELCPGGPIKQVALQIIEKLKNVNFTKVTSDESILERLASLNKILNINEDTAVSVQHVSSSLERIIKFFGGDQSLENSTHSLISPFGMILNANLTGSVEALSSFIKKSEATYNFEELWLEFERIMNDLTHDVSIRPLFSEINKDIQMINSVALQNITLQFGGFLENLDSSSVKTLEIIEDFLLVVKNWLSKHANEDYSRVIQRFLPMVHESSSDDMLTKGTINFSDYLKNVSQEDNFDVPLLTHLLNQEQLTNFSVVWLLLESFLINSVNNLARSSQEASLNLSDTDLQIINSINLTLNHTESEDGDGINFPPRNIMDFMQWLLKKFFSFSLKENSENKISLLLKDFHKDIIAGMSFVPKDEIPEILKLNQLLNSTKEDRLMGIFSSLKESLYHLIKSSFVLEDGKFYFDNHQGLKIMGDLFNALLWEMPIENKNENNLEFLKVVSQLLFHMNNSENIFKLNQDLRSALHLVQETSTEIASLMDALLNSPSKDFQNLYPTLQEVILAQLTHLLSFVTNSFPLRNRATLEITKRFLGVISRVEKGGESHVLEPLLEMSNTLIMLVRDTAEMGELATSVNSTVALLKLAKKVSRKMADIFETHFISKTNDTVKFFDSLYSVLQQSVQQVVHEIITLKKTHHFIFENINDLLTPFLDLAFGMIGVKPNISQDSNISNMSSSIFAYVNQSKDFSDILEEIAGFLTSVKINLGDMEHLVVALNNGTQIFSTDSVNLGEEVLNCFVPINNIVNQIDFLHPEPVSTHSFPQDPKWERTHQVILFLDEMLFQNTTEIGTYLRILLDLTLEALWNSLEKGDWNSFTHLLTFAQHPKNLLKTIKTVVEGSRGTKSDHASGSSEALFLNTSLIQNETCQQMEAVIQMVLRRIALMKKEFLLSNSLQINSTRTLFQPISKIFINAGKNTTSGKEERTKKDVIDFPPILKPVSCFEKYLRGLLALTEYWQKVPLTDQR